MAENRKKKDCKKAFRGRKKYFDLFIYIFRFLL